MKNIEIKQAINKLQALEKAGIKAQKAIDNYNAELTNYYKASNKEARHEIFEALKPRTYFEKAANLLVKSRKEHEKILSNLWNKGIFV